MNLIRRGRLFFFRRNFKSHRLGKFWCNKHWKIIEDSQLEKNPINPTVAALGVTAALHLRNVDAAFVRREGRACCILFNIAEVTPKLMSGSKLLDGIFERSRGWYEDGEQFTRSTPERL